MAIEESKDDQHKEVPDSSETAPLAQGVWVTESAGSAAVPPRAHSDLKEVCDEEPAKDPSSTDTSEPRIERYRER